MFSEVLRILPRLDSGATKDMEGRLSLRFESVARRFKGGLMAALKGSVLGLSLGLLNRLLNPIEALEEKIKSLLDQGSDIRDLAQEMNTTPGRLKQLQDVASSVGVKPEQLNEMMHKFAQAVENARAEIADPTKPLSEQAQAVKNFVGSKDMAESFFTLLQDLKKVGTGQGRQISVGDPQHGILRQLSGLESRQEFEKVIFGDKLRGGARKLVETDAAQQLAKLNEPGAEKLSAAINKTADLKDQQNLLETKNNTAGFLGGADRVNAKMIQDMENAKAAEERRTNRQLESYDDLRKASDGIEKLKDLATETLNHATRAVGYLGVVADWVDKTKKAPIFRGIFGDFFGK